MIGMLSYNMPTGNKQSRIDQFFVPLLLELMDSAHFELVTGVNN